MRTRFTARALAIAAAIAAAVVASASVLAVVSEDVVEGNGLVRSDPANLRFFIDHRSSMLLDLARNITQLGSFGLLVALALAATVLLWFKGARLVLAIAPLVSLAVGGVVCAVGKQLVGRPRPSLSLRLVRETEPSFPSGHTTDSTAFYVALAIVVGIVLLRRPLARAVVMLASTVISGLVGLSRLVLGVHWPTDVIAGWALGLLVALVVTTAAALLAGHPPAEELEGASRLQRAVHRGRRLATRQRVASLL
ncbi:MAG: hypothetical protein QOJ67_1719 [Acidimicrobiaceae bacterium]